MGGRQLPPWEGVERIPWEVGPRRHPAAGESGRGRSRAGPEGMYVGGSAEGGGGDGDGGGGWGGGAGDVAAFGCG